MAHFEDLAYGEGRRSPLGALPGYEWNVCLLEFSL